MMERHPLSAVWGDMPEAEFLELCKDVGKQGVRETIQVFEGRVLDGWHRYRAALKTGKEPPLREYIGGDPVYWVVSKNNRRRHLSAADRVRAVQACLAWREKAGRPAGKKGSSEPIPTHRREKLATRAEVAALAQASPATVKRVRQQDRAREAGVRQQDRAREARMRGAATRVRQNVASADVTAPAPSPEEHLRSGIFGGVRPKSETQQLREENRKLTRKVERLEAELDSVRRAKVSAENRLRQSEQVRKGLEVELARARGERLFDGP